MCQSRLLSKHRGLFLYSGNLFKVLQSLGVHPPVHMLGVLRMPEQFLTRV